MHSSVGSRCYCQTSGTLVHAAKRFSTRPIAGSGATLAIYEDRRDIGSADRKLSTSFPSSPLFLQRGV